MLESFNGKTAKTRTGGRFVSCQLTSRGDRREAIYTDDEDREKWSEILGNVCSRFNWRCHAYCLMDSHYHIVIETAEANLSKGMRQLNSVYTQYFNNQHNRVGHVYQGRYKGY